MELRTLFRHKHALWLKLLYGALLLKEGKTRFVLHTFSETQFRHLKWLGETIVDYARDETHYDKSQPFPMTFDFDRDPIDITTWDSDSTLLKQLLGDTKQAMDLNPGGQPILDRIASDDAYFLYRLEELFIGRERWDSLEGGFNFDGIRQKEALGLDEAQLSLLVQTLREQNYKEYKTVISFCYLLAHTERLDIYHAFYDLMWESLTHQKHYAMMMASIGALEIPPIVPKAAYQIGDVKQFIETNLAEEEKEQAELLTLSTRIPYEGFQRLVTFVANQEKHHIAILNETYSTLYGHA